MLVAILVALIVIIIQLGSIEQTIIDNGLEIIIKKDEEVK